ncbi:MAG TPA: NAD(P)-dependent oxidoreductase [Acidiphilium sp.]
MTEHMQQFVRLPQQTPVKRGAGERRTDFGEIYQHLDQDSARAQASRCSQCGVPFCQIHCPLGNNIPDWLKLSSEGRLEEAYEVSAATNTFPEICGRICPQDRLCEAKWACTLEQSGHGTVTIGAIERYITDTAFENGWVRPIRPRRERGQSVGIIGAGPAGLAAAEALRQQGYAVHVYDRHDRIGGLMIYGIPGFKLDKSIVERRHAWLADGGIVFHLNQDIGRTQGFAALRDRHDAILIATGVYKAREIAAPGSGLPGIVPALDYLIASNRKCLGDTVPDFDSGLLDAGGKRVVVIGGGDTAMDCVRTAIRQNAASVTCLYRRDRANMPGSMREVANAEDEGVKFTWLAAPEAFLGDERVTGVRTIRMHLGLADASGRQTVEPIHESAFTVEADLVIKALGFDPEDMPEAFGEKDLALTRWGTVKVDPKSFATSLPGVFAAGDIVRGASLVVWAIREGRDAAAAMHTYLEQNAVRGADALAVAAE